MLLTVKQRKRLKKYYRRGDIDRLADVCDCSRANIHNWFNGLHNSELVKDAVEYLAAKREAEVKTSFKKKL